MPSCGYGVGMTSHFKRDGFPGQRLIVVPRSLVRAALALPVTSAVLVTDAGYFPHADLHRRTRRSGAEQHVIILCVHGKGWVQLGDGPRLTLGEREACVIPAGTPHAYGADLSDPWSIWFVHLAGSLAPDLVAAIEVDAGAAFPVTRLASVTELLVGIVDTISRDASRSSLLAASGSATRLMTELAAGRYDVDQGDVTELIRTYLSEDLADPLSVSDVARRVSMSPSHMTALFSKKTGFSPMEFRTLKRMQRARELLDTTNRPVASIAAEVGYPDAAYFTRRFRQLHEQGPRAYRNNVKG